MSEPKLNINTSESSGIKKVINKEVKYIFEETVVPLLGIDSPLMHKIEDSAYRFEEVVENTIEPYLNEETKDEIKTVNKLISYFDK